MSASVYKAASAESSSRALHNPDDGWCWYNRTTVQVRSPATELRPFENPARQEGWCQERRSSMFGRPPYYAVCCSHTFLPYCIRLFLTRPPTPLCRCRLGKGGFEAALSVLRISPNKTPMFLRQLRMELENSYVATQKSCLKYVS